MTTAPALRPCPVPWCGSRHISLESFGGDKLFVARCPSCGARSPASRSQSEAIAAWNARPGGDEAVRLRALAKELSDTLLLLRPLGGSECFRRVGESYFADASYFSRFIEREREELFETKKKLARAQKELSALRTHGASHD